MNTLDLPKVIAKTSVSKTTLYGQIKANAFPRPVKIGRKSVWVEDEIDAWLKTQADSRPASSKGV